jgi:hypothetical protein
MLSALVAVFSKSALPAIDATPLSKIKISSGGSRIRRGGAATRWGPCVVAVHAWPRVPPQEGRQEGAGGAAIDAPQPQPRADEEADDPKPSREAASPLTGISFNLSGPSSESLPEFKPSSQDELITQQSRQLLQRRSLFTPVSEGVLKCNRVSGLAMSVTEIAPIAAGLEIGVSVLNTSNSAISSNSC